MLCSVTLHFGAFLAGKLERAKINPDTTLLAAGVFRLVIICYNGRYSAICSASTSTLGSSQDKSGSAMIIRRAASQAAERRLGMHKWEADAGSFCEHAIPDPEQNPNEQVFALAPSNIGNERGLQSPPSHSSMNHGSRIGTALIARTFGPPPNQTGALTVGATSHHGTRWRDLIFVCRKSSNTNPASCHLGRQKDPAELTAGERDRP
jgi:hypothetical protein